MSKDMCQADSTAVGSDGIAPEGALQAGDGGGPEVGQYGETKSDQAYQVIGTLASVANCFDDPEVQRALDYFSEDRFDPKFLPFKRPSQIEEPQRGDTVTAEQREAGLTQKFKSRAQEIVDNCPALGCCEYYKLIIPQALSTSYEEGRRDEAIARRLAFEEAMRAAKDPAPIPASKAYCAFCGQGDAEVGMDKLVEGPTVCICAFCVKNASLVLDSRKASANA